MLVFQYVWTYIISVLVLPGSLSLTHARFKITNSYEIAYDKYRESLSCPHPPCTIYRRSHRLAIWRYEKWQYRPTLDCMTFVFLLSFPLSLPFDWTLRCYVSVVLFCYILDAVLCVKKIKINVDNKEKKKYIYYFTWLHHLTQLSGHIRLFWKMCSRSRFLQFDSVYLLVKWVLLKHKYELQCCHLDQGRSRGCAGQTYSTDQGAC